MTQPAIPDFRLLLESAPDLYLVLLPDLTIVAVSDSYLAASMTRRADILGRGLFDVFPDNPDDTDATGTANLRRSLDIVRRERRPNTMAVQKYDVRRLEEQGGGFEERFWSPRNCPVLDAAGDLVYIIHRVEDVTEYVRAKALHVEQVELAKELASRADAMEREVFARAQEIQRANAELRLLKTELESRVEVGTAKLEKEIADRERTEAALHRSEEQLRQAQKLEAVGRLAAGIAHDFNNLLTVVLTYSSLTLRRMPEDSAHRGGIEQIRDAGIRAADLTRQLLAFSRQQVLELRTLDVNDVVRGLSKMLPRLLREDVELACHLSSERCLIRADASQLEQVFMNLAVNALDAMPDGGKLTIETANVDLSENLAREHLGLSAGSYVQISVSDNGVGMDASIQSRVFEPFFTTKDRSRGTGLGLSTVFGIVKQSGGSIWLYSEPGAGTTFKIYFPRVRGDAEEIARERPDGPLPGGTETILLVEDLDEVRRAAREVLTTYGYTVLDAGSVGEALRIAENPGIAIDMLLTDVVMPKTNGRELARAVVRLRPGIKVLFMSGYTDDVIVHHGVLDPGVAYLQKPLTPETLTRKVRERLDSRHLEPGQHGARTREDPD